MARVRTLVLAAAVLCAGVSRSDDLRFRQRLLGEMIRQIPDVLAGYHPDTGRFQTGRAWDQRAQRRMHILAVAYTTPAERNPYHQSKRLLGIIVKAGDALIEAQDDRGRWLYTKSDGSQWGWRYQEWTYSRWVDTFELVREHMPADARERWRAALEMAFTHMDRYLQTRLDSELVDNHRVEMAASIYAAGQALGHPEWCEHAARYMLITASQQSPNGYWSEGGGPVLGYNFEYLGSLGRYYARSGDSRILPALERATRFHCRFTYPDGHPVETIDQRNWFSGAINQSWDAFSLTPVGRAYLKRQWEQPVAALVDAEVLARLIHWGSEGPIQVPPEFDIESEYIMPVDGVPRATVIRRGPWYICLSAIVTPVAQNRFYLDRQSFVSIYHDRLGLIVGGGNGKMQPCWSSFTLGDTSLLRHTPKDEDPTFAPPAGLYHVPWQAQLVRRPLPGLVLDYERETCRISVDIIDDATLEYVVSATAVGRLPVEAHLTLLPRIEDVTDRDGRPVNPWSTWVRKPIPADPRLLTAAGGQYPLTSESIDLEPGQIGGWIEYGGYRLLLPDTASVHWPVIPHNGYRKDGAGRTYEGRIEVRVPLDAEHPEYRLRFEVLQCLTASSG